MTAARAVAEEVVRFLICALSYIMVNDEETRNSFEESDGMSVESAWSLVFKILETYRNGKIGAACAYLASTCASTEEGRRRLQEHNVWKLVYDTVDANQKMHSTVMGGFTFCYHLLMTEFGHGILDHNDCLHMISVGMKSFLTQTSSTSSRAGRPETVACVMSETIVGAWFPQTQR